MPEDCKEGYDAKLEQKKLEIAKKAEKIMEGLSKEERKKVEDMKPKEQSEFFAKKIEEKEGKDKFHIKDEKKILGKHAHKLNSKNNSKGGAPSKKNTKSSKKSKSKKHKRRLLEEAAHKDKKSPFEHPALDIAYRLVHACSGSMQSISWFNL